MKKLINLSAIFLLLFSCYGQHNNEKIKKFDTQKNIETKNSLIVEEYQIPNIPIASLDSLNLKIKNGLLKDSEKIEGLSLNNSKDFNIYNYEAINKLFLLDFINHGIFYRTSENILIYEMYYVNNQSKKIFENIKNTIKNTEDYQTYHDYLKTGRVFILKRNKIIMFEYNPFSTPKIHDVVDKFLKKNHSYFDQIIRVYGMNNVEILK